MRGWHKRFWMSLRTYSLRRRGILRRAGRAIADFPRSGICSTAGITANAWAYLRGFPCGP